MRVLGICCSPKAGQTTYKAMEACLASAGQVEGVETELIELAGKTIGPCTDCGICKQGLICGWDDDFGELIPKLADERLGGLIVGTPVYFGLMTAQCKALLDRCVMFRRNGWRFKDVVGGALAVGKVRNGGQELTCQAIRMAMGCQDMICVSDGQETAHFGAALCSGVEGGIEADEAGLATAANLGRRVAQLARRLQRQSNP